MGEYDLRLLTIGISLWIGAACAGLFPWSLLLLLIPLFKEELRFFVFVALAGAAISGIHQFSLHHNSIKPLILNHVKVTLIAEVDTDPHLTTPKVVGSYLKARTTTFQAQSISLNGSHIRVPLRMSFTHDYKATPGSVFQTDVELVASSEKKVAAIAIARGNYQILHDSNQLERITDQIRSSFKSVVGRFAGDGASLIPGLVIGDTSLQSQSFTQQMRRVGLTHLTAVSGENFAIISAFFLFLMRFLFRRYEWRLIATAVALIIFIVLVRPSPSVLRAAVMTGVLLFSKARGETHSALPALGFAIALLVSIDPFQAIDPGFALSVSATAGILLFAPHLKLPDALSIPLSATFFTLPIIVALSGQFSFFALPANLLASMAVAPITISGFIAALMSPIFPGISFLIVAAILPFAQWIAFIAHFGSHIPSLQLPGSYFGAIVVMLVLILTLRKMWKIAFLCALLVVGNQIYSATTWPGDWWILQCNIGQGDGEAINLNDGRAIVIDVGPDPDAIDRCLKRIHIKEIPLLILTHGHADHINGLSGAIRGRKVGTIWRTENAGDSYDIGEMHIDVVWPDKAEQEIAPLARSGTEINNTSIGVVITYQGHRFFTGGDMEPAAQDALLAKGIEKVDVMKVCHHGSSHQSDALFQALDPSIAFISVGKDNPYGHPSLRTINYLEALGSRVFRTDKSGDIAIDSHLHVRTHQRELFTLG